jgi:hypothetical protein
VALLEWLRDKRDFLNSHFTNAPTNKSAARTAKMLMESYSLEYEDRLGDLKALHGLGAKLMTAGYAKWRRVFDLFEKIAVGFSEASIDQTKQGQRVPPLPIPNPPGAASITA